MVLEWRAIDASTARAVQRVPVARATNAYGQSRGASNGNHNVVTTDGVGATTTVRARVAMAINDATAAVGDRAATACGQRTMSENIAAGLMPNAMTSASRCYDRMSL